MKPEVLLVSIGFPPNVGGIETHFIDLLKALKKRYWLVKVLTYQPLTSALSAPVYEQSLSLTVFRLPIVRGFFYQLVRHPLLEFLYLTPGLFLALPLLLLTTSRNCRVIHSHGLIAGFVSVFWGRLFGKRVVTTTHSVYNFNSFAYRLLARWIFKNCNQVLTLSRKSKSEIEALRIHPNQVTVFTYWVDLKKFTPIKQASNKLAWTNKFVVFFVGRLIPEKGVLELLKAWKKWNKKIVLAVAGVGPLETEIQKHTGSRLIYLGRVDQERLALYYSAAKLTIVPSTHEEGFGRVIIESLACGTPVIGANRGAIPEAMTSQVGRLIKISPMSIATTVDHLYAHPQVLRQLAKKTRGFAKRRYSEANIRGIISSYG